MCGRKKNEGIYSGGQNHNEPSCPNVYTNILRYRLLGATSTFSFVENRGSDEHRNDADVGDG
jgi:hypothetical protein